MSKATSFGPPMGTRWTGPLRTHYDGVTDFVFGYNPMGRVCLWHDFVGPTPTYDVYVPIYDVTADAATVLTGVNSRGNITIPRAGVLIAADIVAEDTLATDDTNYLTFDLMNKLGAGAGSVAMLAATDPNTTKTTGGAALTANIPRALTVSGTAASLRVAAGDVLIFTATKAGTLANAVDIPLVRLRFATIGPELTPLIARTAGNPLVAPVDDTANGEIVCTGSATNEVNTMAVYWGDNLQIAPTRKPILAVRAKFSTHSTAERAVLGFCSAYNATWDSTSFNTWFRLEATMALRLETDDNATNTDDQLTGETLTADTYYWFGIDMSDLADVKFCLWDADGTNKRRLLQGTTMTMAAAVVTDLLQFFAGTQKDSGTGARSVTLDCVLMSWDRS